MAGTPMKRSFLISAFKPEEWYRFFGELTEALSEASDRAAMEDPPNKGEAGFVDDRLGHLIGICSETILHMTAIRDALQALRNANVKSIRFSYDPESEARTGVFGTRVWALFPGGLELRASGNVWIKHALSDLVARLPKDPAPKA